MRLAFVVYGGLDNVSGGFIYDRALADALTSLGHDVDVVGLPWRGYLGAVASGIARGRRRSRPPRYDAAVVDELCHPSVFRRARDVAPAAVTVALVHNLTCEQPGTRWPTLAARVERRFLAGVDGAIAVCDRTLAGVRRLAGAALPALVARAGRDHVAPHVDETLVDQRSRQPGPLRILHAASVVPAKGLRRLLGALAALAAREPACAFTLDVAGDVPPSPYARAVHHDVDRLGLAPRVRLHGQLRGAPLHDLFRGSHVLALPSDREAYSLACLEALGYGLPVLATAAGGLGEMIASDGEGALLDPGDTGSWARALGRLASDRDALAAGGRAALARYRAHATWREVARDVQRFIEAVRPAPAAR